MFQKHTDDFKNCCTFVVEQDVSGTHPSFVLNRDDFEVLFKNVKREDEGLYTVTVKDQAGRVKKTFNYIMIVMGET